MPVVPYPKGFITMKRDALATLDQAGRLDQWGNGWLNYMTLERGPHFSSVKFAGYTFGSNSTIHSIPYLSLNIPAYVPQGLSPMGPSTSPPADNPLNIWSASSLLSALTTILDLFSLSFTRPMNSGTSLAINTLCFPIGNAMVI